MSMPTTYPGTAPQVPQFHKVRTRRAEKTKLHGQIHGSNTMPTDVLTHEKRPYNTPFYTRNVTNAWAGSHVLRAA